MPAFRKVPTEVATSWEKAQPAPSQRDDRYDWTTRPAVLFVSPRRRSLDETPRVGDVLRVSASAVAPLAEAVGVVLGVRADAHGEWVYVRLALPEVIVWFTREDIAEHLGRMRGVTRVDQPSKVIKGRVHGATHAWFARVYGVDQTPTTLARTFSDQPAGGILAALRAALAFHAAHAQLNPAEAVAFG